MKFDRFTGYSKVASIVVVNGVYDPGPVYIMVAFKEVGASIKNIVQELNALGIKCHVAPIREWLSRRVIGEEISGIPGELARRLFDYLEDREYITASDRADLDPLVNQIETTLKQRSLLSDTVTVAQRDIITSLFIDPYLDSIFSNLTLIDSIKIVGLAVAKWNFDPSMGNHANEWCRIIRNREKIDLLSKFSQGIVDNICMSLTILSALSSGTAMLNDTFLQQGPTIPNLSTVKEVLKEYLIGKMEEIYSLDERFTGWKEHFERYLRADFLMDEYRRNQLNTEITSYRHHNKMTKQFDANCHRTHRPYQML